MLEALREWVGRGESQREETLGAMVGLAYNYLEPGMNDQLLEVLTMATHWRT